MDRVFRIAHGWRVCTTEELSGTLISDFIRPAVHAVPPGMARQFGRCEVSLVEHLGSPSIASRWTLTDAGTEISLAMTERDGHDIALELLVCLGQALWEKLSQSQRKAYWLLLDDEIRAGVPGEIDEEALKQKNLLLSSRSSATSRRRLERYGFASFAGTAAEYIHSLWHDVSVRTGPRFVPAERLRCRLELLAGWYPPGRTHPLFPPASRKRKS
jgi:hypothetical protein